MYDAWDEPVGPAFGAFAVDVPPSPTDLVHDGLNPIHSWVDLFDDAGTVSADPIDTAPFVLIHDDYLDYGTGKSFDTGPLATDVNGDGVDDGDTVDEIVLIGIKNPTETPVIPRVEQGERPNDTDNPGGNTGGSAELGTLLQPCSQLPPPLTPAEVEAQADEIARRIDAFISTLNWQTQ